MTFFNTLKNAIDIPVFYGRKIPDDTSLPFVVYTGAGMVTEYADNGHYRAGAAYTVEYYFATKDETAETALEAAFDDIGAFWSKSEDSYISGSDMFVIYYDLTF